MIPSFRLTSCKLSPICKFYSCDYVPTSWEYVPTSWEYVPTSWEYVPTWEYVPASWEYVPTSWEYMPTSWEYVPTLIIVDFVSRVLPRGHQGDISFVHLSVRSEVGTRIVSGDLKI